MEGEQAGNAYEDLLVHAQTLLLSDRILHFLQTFLENNYIKQKTGMIINSVYLICLVLREGVTESSRAVPVSLSWFGCVEIPMRHEYLSCLSLLT